VASVTASNHVFNISAYTINTSILAGHCKGSPVDLLDLVISMATMYSWLSHTSGWNLNWPYGHTYTYLQYWFSSMQTL